MNINALMKQAKKIQDELLKQEAELQEKTYEGTISNDAVKIIVSGKGLVESIFINEDLIEKDNKEMLEDMVMMAVNDALQKMNEDKEAVMGKLTGGAKVPGIF